jgi:hypothetical protein
MLLVQCVQCVATDVACDARAGSKNQLLEECLLSGLSTYIKTFTAMIFVRKECEAVFPGSVLSNPRCYQNREELATVSQNCVFRWSRYVKIIAQCPDFLLRGF